jgi:hypothetical protein|tara:strand:+ start:244 stop:387 length:144 start_codon:yes stop_codon:yes gene_type:complete
MAARPDVELMKMTGAIVKAQGSADEAGKGEKPGVLCGLPGYCIMGLA